MCLTASKVRHPALRSTFKTIIEDWLKLMKSYCQKVPGDGLYCYTERATLSTLAGVIWRREEYALEAYSENKKEGKKGFIGRADLWFATKSGIEFNIEAKQEWPLISKRANVFGEKMERALKKAAADAKKIKDSYPDDDSKYIGVVFAAPYLPSSDSAKENIPERLKRFIEAVKEVDCDFYGYYLVEDSEVYGKKDNLFPGVAILGALVE